jgi:hypothetical protein
VTVVATGLNRQTQRQSQDHSFAGLRNVRVVRGGSGSDGDNGTVRSPLRRPSVVPQVSAGAATASAQTPAPVSIGSVAVASQEDYLDIPTFLRRQAD